MSFMIYSISVLLYQNDGHKKHTLAVTLDKMSLGGGGFPPFHYNTYQCTNTYHVHLLYVKLEKN